MARAAALPDFALAEFRGQLCLRAFAQNRQRHARAFAHAPDEFPELIGLGQDLIIQHLQDVVLLHTGRGRGAVRHDVIDHEAEAFREPELFGHDAGNV